MVFIHDNIYIYMYILKINLVWYQRNCFCTQKPTHKDWIYQNILINDKYWRVYDTEKYSCEQIYLNEIGWFFEHMLNQNLKIYYVSGSPKHNILYTQECFDFFKQLRECKQNVIMPENIKQLRELQSNDLMYFYDNLILESFHIISKIKNNLYYFDMIIIVKNDYDIHKFKKINFDTIKIESITPIFYENITYNYMQQIFNFEELNYCAFYNYLNKEFLDCISNTECVKTKERENLEKYESEHYDIEDDDLLYWQYWNDCNGAASEIWNQKLFFKNYSSQFGFYWFVLNYNFKDQYSLVEPISTYPINDYFYRFWKKFTEPYKITDFDDVKKVGNNLLFFKKTNISYIIDLLSATNKYCLYFYIISVPKIKYNTSYKCRLKKKNK